MILYLDACSSSAFLRTMYILKTVISLIRIVVPILLIVMVMIDIVRSITKDVDAIAEIKEKSLKKIFAAILVFLVPLFVGIVANIIGFTKYNDCFMNVTESQIKETKDREDAIKEQEKLERQKKLEASKEKESNSSTKQGEEEIKSDEENLECPDSYKNNPVSSEPNPLKVISCYPNNYKVENFIDKGNLGAWPKNYQSYASNIGNCGNNLLFPVDGSFGNQGSKHGGLDIGWSIGTPMYAPASGMASYSWGCSSHFGGESDYCVNIRLYNPFKLNIEGRTFVVTYFWMGHMVGIVHRGSKSVAQGELIGYRGTAATRVDANGNKYATLAPHLHWSFYGYWEDDASNKRELLNNEQLLKAYSTLSSSSLKAGTCMQVAPSASLNGSNNKNEKYQIVFDYNGGKTLLGATNAVYNLKIGAKTSGPLIKPSLKGKKFSGWYETNNCGNKVSMPIVVSSNKTVYAGWNCN